MADRLHAAGILRNLLLVDLGVWWRRQAAGVQYSSSAFTADIHPSDIHPAHGYPSDVHPAHVHSAERIRNFMPLEHYVSDKRQFQAGPQQPDPVQGWVSVTRHGGHPGEQASVRRFTAPRAGVLRLTGELKHGQKIGDGVRGRLVSSRNGALGEWRALTNAARTDLPRIRVQAGETIDFAVDRIATDHEDAFQWEVELAMIEEAQPVPPGAPAAWNSPADFGPRPTVAQSVDLFGLCRPPA